MPRVPVEQRARLRDDAGARIAELHGCPACVGRLSIEPGRRSGDGESRRACLVYSEEYLLALRRLAAPDPEQVERLAITVRYGV